MQEYPIFRYFLLFEVGISKCIRFMCLHRVSVTTLATPSSALRTSSQRFLSSQALLVFRMWHPRHVCGRAGCALNVRLTGVQRTDKSLRCCRNLSLFGSLRNSLLASTNQNRNRNSLESLYQTNSFASKFHIFCYSEFSKTHRTD